MDVDQVPFKVRFVNVPCHLTSSDICKVVGDGSEVELVQGGTAGLEQDFLVAVYDYKRMIELCREPQYCNEIMLTAVPDDFMTNPFQKTTVEYFNCSRLQTVPLPSKVKFSRNRILCVGPFGDLATLNDRSVFDLFSLYTTVQSVLINRYSRVAYVRLKGSVADQVFNTVMREDSSSEKATNSLTVDQEKVNLAVLQGFQEHLWWDLTASMTASNQLQTYYVTSLNPKSQRNAAMKLNPSKKPRLMRQNDRALKKKKAQTIARGKKVSKKSSSKEPLSSLTKVFGLL